MFDIHPLYLQDRRNRMERRKFLYSMHIPELRTGKDRRSGLERRKTPRQQIGETKMGANIGMME